jgi:hypothetical protein
MRLTLEKMMRRDGKQKSPRTNPRITAKDGADCDYSLELEGAGLESVL